jgi:hypothetical protein
MIAAIVFLVTLFLLRLMRRRTPQQPIVVNIYQNFHLPPGPGEKEPQLDQVYRVAEISTNVIPFRARR